MESTKTPQEQAISAFKERNIAFKRDDIESVFEDVSTGPASTKWVLEHLSPDTLLSKEETSLYGLLIVSRPGMSI
jgi:hypothetical protein